eukprot:CAMPEP_0118828932 /NCGR_PEP_ID=MMETSP1162-20130426/20940_1 /TAXON_ID=33656 /ORGANISM="Phaeocystis Sp, Strain CCMP2710" /LENGTH=250 /DNA_ID=CAMNT_0006760023 /DNA_START=398 /DNA_END=1147 /DNA_ORIENTATION=-
MAEPPAALRIAVETILAEGVDRAYGDPVLEAVLEESRAPLHVDALGDTSRGECSLLEAARRDRQVGAASHEGSHCGLARLVGAAGELAQDEEERGVVQVRREAEGDLSHRRMQHQLDEPHAEDPVRVYRVQLPCWPAAPWRRVWLKADADAGEGAVESPPEEGGYGGRVPQQRQVRQCSERDECHHHCRPAAQQREDEDKGRGGAAHPDGADKSHHQASPERVQVRDMCGKRVRRPGRIHGRIHGRDDAP